VRFLVRMFSAGAFYRSCVGKLALSLSIWAHQIGEPGLFSAPRLADSLQGYLAHKKTPTPLGPPYDPRHRPTVGSSGGAFSYERGTPVRKLSMST